MRKLGIKPGARLGLIGAPDGFRGDARRAAPGRRGPPPRPGPARRDRGLHARRAELERRLPALRAALDPAGGLWIAWPKRASGLETDLSENVVRELGLAAGLVDNKVCAIDETWSGLRFVYRLRDRPT